MSATDLMTRRNRFEVIFQWDVIGEVFVLDARHIVVERRPMLGILVRRGKRWA